MSFDAKSLLTEPLPPDLTVDGLAVALAQLQKMGMGGAGLKLPDGQAINQVELVAHGVASAHFVLKRKLATRPLVENPLLPEGEMINGETVEIRKQNDYCWYRGVVDRAHKMWVVQLTPLNPEDFTPDPEHVACENTIAEWRRPGTAISFWNSMARDTVPRKL